MIKNLYLKDFISNNVTGRTQSLLSDDYKKYDSALRAKIDGSSALVIG